MPKIPSVSIYIRITDQRGRRRYERIKARNPQVCGPKDQYCLLYYDPKQTWEQIGQDFGEALNRRFARLQQFARCRELSAGVDESARSGTDMSRSPTIAKKNRIRLQYEAL